jgi:hypothetical protein
VTNTGINLPVDRGVFLNSINRRRVTYIGRVSLNVIIFFQHYNVFCVNLSRSKQIHSSFLVREIFNIPDEFIYNEFNTLEFEERTSNQIDLLSFSNAFNKLDITFTEIINIIR